MTSEKAGEQQIAQEKDSEKLEADERATVPGCSGGNRTNVLQASALKRKSDSDKQLAVGKGARVYELNNHIVGLLQPRIPLKNIMDLEMKLVYVDEQDIAYEFIESLVASNAQSTCRAAEEVGSVRALNYSFLPETDKWIQVALKEASTCYRQKKYAIAAGRSITLNPTYFRNHLRQATVFRSLARYSEAARSAMIADYIYWLSGGREKNISKLIKLYWQAMLEEAITRAETFSVMYTPFAAKLKPERTEKVKESFTKRHPSYAGYIYTDPKALHILPQTTDWSTAHPQQYLLTLGFKNKEDGFLIEKTRRQLHTFRENKNPLSPLSNEETEKHFDILWKRILPVLNFTRCTKFLGGSTPCSGVIAKLQYASILHQLQRVKEQSQVIHQALAELATIPYLQDISQQDAGLLQSLTADAMECLEGRSDKEYVWNKIQKVGQIEDFLYQLEDSYLKAKKRRTARRQRMKMKRLQTAQLC
ncbi:hypothetical protein FKM82_004160, partial [Ascaphus truei]